MVAFGRLGGQANPQDLVEIGRRVVKKCANVPLAIRVAGSLLFGQPTAKWESIDKSRFADFDLSENGILPILKFSYYHLDSPLKCCFSYCALFPKDYTIEKETLIRLWEAQGYIVPSAGERKEDVAEEYFSILLRRCFFQDVEKNIYGEIISCKIHDLLHYVAQQVAGKEISIVDHFTGKLEQRNVHLNVVKTIDIKRNLSRKTVRTLLYESYKLYGKFDVGILLENWMSLRVLVLRHSELEKIPDTIGKLLHLRYLDFSLNVDLVKLPKSLTKLHNLETLMLRHCEGLRELPSDINKLVKLRCLDIVGCYELSNMPESIGKLTSLQTLRLFVVNMRNSLQWTEGLEGLRALMQLKGSLRLEIFDFEDATYAKQERGEGAVLINKQHLNQIVLSFQEEDRQDNQEALLERLQPHQNLKHLCILGYKGGRLPSWAIGHELGSSLSNLVIMELSGCDGLKYLSSMGKMRHLRILKLKNLSSLEYMEESRNRSHTEGEYLFFPSLEELKLINLPKLKGWWREEGKKDDLHSQPSPSFLHLSMLSIKECEELTLIPAISSVEKLILCGVNERLRIRVGGVNEKEEKALGWKEVKGPTCYAQCRIKTDNVGLLKWLLSRKALRCLITELDISCKSKETLEEEVEVWRSCSSSLRILTIEFCSDLKSVYKGGLEYLSALENLTVRACENLTMRDDKSSLSSSLYPPFSHTLRSLGLFALPKLVNLPEWMQHLNSLQSLYIQGCKSLESLPEWMQNLTSLTTLDILGCSKEMEQRCSPNLPGQYWPYICHIRNVQVLTIIPL